MNLVKVSHKNKGKFLEFYKRQYLNNPLKRNSLYGLLKGLINGKSDMSHPDWNKRDFQLFREFIKELEPQIYSVSPLTPFPNLPMYKQYENRLIFKKEGYEKWSFGQVIINLSKMSLRRYYYELLKTNLYINLMIKA